MLSNIGCNKKEGVSNIGKIWRVSSLHQKRTKKLFLSSFDTARYAVFCLLSVSCFYSGGQIIIFKLALQFLFPRVFGKGTNYFTRLEEQAVKCIQYFYFHTTRDLYTLQCRSGKLLIRASVLKEKRKNPAMCTLYINRLVYSTDNKKFCF